MLLEYIHTHVEGCCTKSSTTHLPVFRSVVSSAHQPANVLWSQGEVVTILKVT